LENAVSVEILPFDPALIAERQPWLNETQILFSKQWPDMPDRMGQYILTLDGKIVVEPNMWRAGMMREQPHGHPGYTYVSRGSGRNYMPSYEPGECYVSTIFLGNCLGMFETMIFGGWLDSTQVRSDTYEEAMKVHAAGVDAARRVNNWLKRRKRGRWAKKLYKKWVKQWDYATHRGPHWMTPRQNRFEAMLAQVRRIPGEPPFPLPDLIFDVMRWVGTRTSFDTDTLILPINTEIVL
jgi:hypothetical protein